MSERKLATITEVATVFPIPGADFIEGITMSTNSWECVVKKGEVQPGDKALYLEIDSAIPVKDKRFAFLADAGCTRTMNGQRVYRLRTVKRKKQISQGLALPLTDFPEFANCKSGYDVTEKLGVTVYDRQPPRVGRFGFLMGRAAGKFPGFIRKTDQERIQSMSRSLLERIQDHPFETTIKMDGTSCSMYCNNGKFGVCSRNLELRDPNIRDPFLVRVWNRIKKVFGYDSRPSHFIDNSVYWDMEKRYGIRDRLTEYCKATGRNLALQGEICGPGIGVITYDMLHHIVDEINHSDDDIRWIRDVQVAAGLTGNRPSLGLTPSCLRTRRVVLPGNPIGNRQLRRRRVFTQAA